MIIQIDRYKMHIDPNQGGIHHDLLNISKKQGRQREPLLLYLLENNIFPNDCCIDLGANIGYVTLLMASLAKSVHAIEPDPKNLELLRHNVSMNGYDDKVTIYGQGISNFSGYRSFHVGRASNLGGMTKTKNTTNESIKVRVQTLADLCRTNHFLPNLIKMDIEGHEVEVLQGFHSLAQDEFPCKIVMELHPTEYNEDHSLEQQFRKLLRNGFRTAYVVSAGVPQPEKFRQWGYMPVKTIGGRALYDSFSDEHMIQACCHQHKQWVPGKDKYSPKIARFVMLARK